ncbi:MAG TPA: sigma-70 family RNA polymerase sigma factor [Candidatus Nanoarchaeia archaeon]|nr:sigma-70 family RNA polymerase sigma factor [Candidatus Nanoarchaeia archaeon]
MIGSITEFRLLTGRGLQQVIDGEDIVHQVFSSNSVREKLAILKKPQAYLARAIINDINDMYNKWRAIRRSERVYAEDANSRPQAWQSEPFPYDSKEEGLSDRIRPAIDSINARYRKIVTLRHMQHLGINEIARQLRIKPRSVSRYLWEANREMAKYLKLP